MTDRELLEELKGRISNEFNINVYEGEWVLRDGSISHFYFEKKEHIRRVFKYTCPTCHAQKTIVNHPNPPDSILCGWRGCADMALRDR